MKEDWIFGIHGVRAALTAAPERVRRVVIAAGRRARDAQAVAALATAAGVRVETAPRAALERYAAGVAFAGSHQGVAAQRQAIAAATEQALEARWPLFETPLLAVLDGVGDAGNLGACLRTAAAAGVDAVLLPKRGTAPLSSATAKAASGALEHVFLVAVANLAHRLTWLQRQGVWLTGGVAAASGEASPESRPYTGVDYRSPTAIVVGGEQQGLRALTRKRCDYLVHIPVAAGMPSLNVSVALGVLLFEARRQRAAGEAGGSLQSSG